MALIIHNSDNNKKKFKHEIDKNIHNNIELAKIISQFQGFAKEIDKFQNIETAQKIILKEIKRLSGGNKILSESELKELKNIFNEQLELSNNTYLELGLDNIPIAEYQKKDEFEKQFNTSLKVSYSVHKSILELLNKYNFKENIMSYLERELFNSEPEKQKKGLTIIDNNFIESIRTNFYGIRNYNFKNESKLIVPKDFTHEYLMQNFKIDINILKYYYATCKDLISDEEFQQEAKKGYIGSKETMLIPYPYIVFGAYFSRNSLYNKLIRLQGQNVLLNGIEIKYLEDLIPYFKEYAKGFENGYNKFENVCIKKYLNEYSDKKDYTNKIFEYVTKDILFKHSWLNNGNSSFTISVNNKKDIKTIIGAFEDGQKQGYYYKAWSIIFSNNDLYKPYFDKLQTSSIEQPKAEQTKTYPKLYFKDFFIKDIDKLKIDAIKEQFCNLKGKNIAILIQLLEKEKIINIIENSKNQSRKHFVEALLDKTVSMQNINSYLSFNNDKHIDTTKTDYIEIEKKLNKIIK